MTLIRRVPPGLSARADEVIEQQRYLLRCMSLLMAQAVWKSSASPHSSGRDDAFRRPSSF
jgi:hypothetical protein